MDAQINCRIKPLPVPKNVKLVFPLESGGTINGLKLENVVEVPLNTLTTQILASLVCEFVESIWKESGLRPPDQIEERGSK